MCSDTSADATTMIQGEACMLMLSAGVTNRATRRLEGHFEGQLACQKRLHKTLPQHLVKVAERCCVKTTAGDPRHSAESDKP
jgi:predicted GIY-YIG superfamily endonuclease